MDRTFPALLPRASRLSAAALAAVLVLTGCAGDDRVAEDGWVPLVDEPSGAQFALPGEPEAHTDSLPADDGSEVPLRNYVSVAEGGLVEVGLNVLDVPGESYDLDAGVTGVAQTLGAEVVSAVDTDVGGNPAVEVELSYGANMLVRFQLISTDEHVLQTLASGPESEREAVEATFQLLNDSLDAD
jgi:hypothetical protein